MKNDRVPHNLIPQFNSGGTSNSLSDREDSEDTFFRWKLVTDGRYTARAAYLAFQQGTTRLTAYLFTTPYKEKDLSNKNYLL